VEYKPVLPEHNDNVSHRHPLKEFAILVFGLLILLGIAYFVLGLLIDFAVSRVSPETEQKWFKNVTETDMVSKLIGDTKVPEKEITELFSSLQSCASIDVPLTLQFVDSEIVNAVAIPGGDIVVYSGLVDALSSVNGLAFVLAHELAHFKHRDHLRGLGRGLAITVLASLVTGTDSGLVNALTPAAMLEQARFSQSRESDADRYALDLLNCHYRHVGGATEFFEAMLEKNQATWKVEHYFASHPEVRTRIEHLNALIQKHNYVVKETIPFDK